MKKRYPHKQIGIVVAAAIYSVVCMQDTKALAERQEVEQEMERMAEQTVGMHEVQTDEILQEESDCQLAYEQELKVAEEIDDWENPIPIEYKETGGYFPAEMQEYTYLLCEEKEIPYSLILAMIELESGYKNDAVSKCGAVGYMQIVEKWHTNRMAKYGFDDLTDPVVNITVGIDFMAELLQKYDMEQALVVYNAGSLIAESTPYSQAVMTRKEELEAEYD